MRSETPADEVPGPARDPDGALPDHAPATSGLPGPTDASDPGTPTGGWAEHLAALHETTLELLERLDVDELLDAIVHRAATLLGTDNGYLYLVRPDGTAMEAHVVIGVFAGWRGNVIHAGEGVAGRVWQTGQPLTVDDYPAWEGRSPRLTGLHRALLGVPLTSEHQVVGVIGLGYVEEDRTFGPQEIELLTGFARLASIALQNARLYGSARGEIAERARMETELRRREAVLRAVAMAAERFLSEGAWEGAIQEVLAALGGAAEVSRVYVFENMTADDGETAATMRFEWAAPGIAPEIDNPAMQPFVFRRDGFARWEQALGAGEIMQANVRELRGSERPVLEAQGILSIVVVPIFVGARWAGFMGFDECRAERAWSSAEIDGLTAAARTLGAAMERQGAQEALRQTEENYRRLVELSPDGIAVHLNGRIVFANSAAARIVGAAGPAELVDRHIIDFIHPSSRPVVVERIRQMREEGRSAPRIEERFVRIDGTPIDVEVAASPLSYEGEPAIQVVVRDVTDRKLSDTRLREAEATYRTLVERLPMVTWIERPDAASPTGFTTTYIGPQIETLLGCSPEEWMGEPSIWRSFLHPADRALAIHTWDEAVEQGGPYEAEYRMLRRDGRIAWVHEDAVLVPAEEGRPQFWLGLLSDITERRRAGEAVRAAEVKYRTLVERLPAVTYVVTGPEGHPLEPPGYVSPQVEDLLGCTAEDWLANPYAWRDFVHPDDVDRIVDEWHAASDTGGAFTSEYRVVDRGGRTKWIRDEAILVRDPVGGGPSFWQGIMTDVSDRMEAEEALRSAFEREREIAQQLRSLDEMKNTFLAAVSHELRTPLSAILGLAVTLERPGLGLSPEETMELLQRLAANARKLDRLLSDLLDLDRLGRGIVEPRRRPTDVGALVRQVVESTEALADHPTRVAAAPTTVSIDGAKVERIIENLLANAARHTPAGTAIRVQVEPHEGGVLVTVDDEGPGVPEDMREAIFEAFRQIPGRSPHSPGVGVGLSLVARFAELHGGRAWVEPRPGGGSSFRVFLPDAEPDPLL